MSVKTQQSKTQKVPKLRFPGFSGAWEEKRLGDISKFFSGGTPTSTNKKYYSGAIPFIKSGEISCTQTDQFITDEAINSSSAKRVVRGDLLYALYGATSGAVAIAKIDGAINQAVLCIRTNEDKNWLYNYLNHKKGSILAKYLQGGQGNLSSDIVKKMKIFFPSLSEQQKIAEFLGATDEWIENLRTQKESLESYKKGMMQKIFSQEIRFKDDNGKDFPEWEEKKVGDVFDVTRGYVLAVKDMSESIKNDNVFPVYSSQTKNNGLIGYYHDYLFEDAITWTTDGANAGDVNFRKGKFYCTNVCGVLINKEGYANNFIAELINSVSRNYVSYVGNPKLMNNVMSQIKIKFPVIEEQIKISEFLVAINNLIELKQQQIAQVENWKNGLMQGLFV